MICSVAGKFSLNGVLLSVKSTILTWELAILSRTTFGYVCDVILLNSKPKNDDPGDILTWPINSLVVGSWYTLDAVTCATTPDCAAII